MKILVKYNDSYYYWVDTIVVRDYTCAILVASNGSAVPICIDEIKIVDDDYNYEKNVQKRIDALKQKNFRLQERMQLDIKLNRIYKQSEEKKIESIMNVTKGGN